MYSIYCIPVYPGTVVLRSFCDFVNTFRFKNTADAYFYIILVSSVKYPFLLRILNASSDVNADWSKFFLFADPPICNGRLLFRSAPDFPLI